MSRQEIETWLAGLRPLIDAELERRLPADQPAMRYAALGEGKRLRPAIALTACAAVGGAIDDALPAAAAVELLHAYTLVHDDLPALDNDDMRRGRPTVHRQFGEAEAILAGDALLTAAFGALADLGPHCAAAVATLARRAGSEELIRGQQRDLGLTDKAAPAGSAALTIDELEAIHRGKTGALFAAAAEIGAIAAGAGNADRDRMSRYGFALGIAFQYADDRDDGEFAALAPVAAERGRQWVAQAIELMAPYGERGRPLAALAEWIGQRL